MQAVLHSGRSLDAAGSALDLAAMFGDGGNLYGYLGGNPRGRSDPLGLFFTSPADLVGHAVMIGMRGVRGGLENMTAEYAANMEDDLDWAMDWSRPDNDYSRLSNTWVAQSFADGMRGGFGAGLNAAMSDLSFGLVGGEEGPFIAGKPRVRVAVATRIRNIRSFDLHHVYPRYIAKALGHKSPVLLSLPRHLHQAYHTALDSALRPHRLDRFSGTNEVKDWINTGNDPRILFNIIKSTTNDFAATHSVPDILMQLLKIMP